MNRSPPSPHNEGHPPRPTDDVERLLAVLPRALREAVCEHPLGELLEVIMDLGRMPQACFPGRCVALSATPVTSGDLLGVVSSIGEFNADNRAGIEGTLHRISAIRNRRREIVGLTMRIGRAVSGTIELVRDLVESGASTLLLGRPGIGKTTRLREIARVMADELGKRVVVVDSSNEIAGEGDIPHPAIGGARRMQVPRPDMQHAVMIEAVENHMPEVIIIDEIGTSAEVQAARTIAERGVQLIGTAHGGTLDSLIANPTLNDLVGGIQTVTLGDDRAQLLGTRKTVRERTAPPTFGAVVELISRHEALVHPDTARAVDQALQGITPTGVRRTAADRHAPLETPPGPAAGEGGPKPARRDAGGRTLIYPYAVSRETVERVIRSQGLEARTVSRPERASVIIGLRARAGDAGLQRITRATGAPLYLVKKNSTSQIRRLLLNILNVLPGSNDAELCETVKETENAIRQVMNEGVAVALAPRTASLRRLQHRIVSRHRLMAESQGREPQRHLVIHPT